MFPEVFMRLKMLRSPIMVLLLQEHYRACEAAKQAAFQRESKQELRKTKLIPVPSCP